MHRASPPDRLSCPGSVFIFWFYRQRATALHQEDISTHIKVIVVKGTILTAAEVMLGEGSLPLAPASPAAPVSAQPLDQGKRTSGKGSCLASATMRLSSVQASPRIAMRLRPIAPVVLALADISAGKGR